MVLRTGFTVSSVTGFSLNFRYSDKIKVKLSLILHFVVKARFNGVFGIFHKHFFVVFSSNGLYLMFLHFKIGKGSYHNIDVRQKAKVLSFGGEGVFLYFI